MGCCSVYQVLHCSLHLPLLTPARPPPCLSPAPHHLLQASGRRQRIGSAIACASASQVGVCGRVGVCGGGGGTAGSICSAVAILQVGCRPHCVPCYFDAHVSGCAALLHSWLPCCLLTALSLACTGLGVVCGSGLAGWRLVATRPSDCKPTPALPNCREVRGHGHACGPALEREEAGGHDGARLAHLQVPSLAGWMLGAAQGRV